jgi:hypothetical protein
MASFGLTAGAQPIPTGGSVTDYPSIQEAIDKNPGKMLYVPAGPHEITVALKISTDNSGLFGPGEIVGTNPETALVEIANASSVQVRDITLSRPEGKTDTLKVGIDAQKCSGLVLDNVTVRNNRTRTTAIRLEECNGAQVRNCLIENYMRICEEDRLEKKGQGYAFMTLGGTGIDIRASAGVLFQGNRVIESNYKPTQELKEKYGLGKFTKRGVRGSLVSEQMWKDGYNNAWHQGAAIHLGVPAKGNYIQLLGNYVENAAQGIDVQGDHVIVSNNIINNAFIGMKAMHGSRNVIITGNQFSKNDLWAIQMSPGLVSHPSGQPDPNGVPMEANVDGYSLIANNIISDFGFGNAAWMWKDAGRYAIRFDEGQADYNPPVSGVLVQGNIVYDTGKDQVLVDGKPQVVPPGYKYAIFVSQAMGGPQDLHFVNNLLHPGTDGVSNVELKP